MYSLKCPVGEFFLTDGEKKIQFEIRDNSFNIPYEICGKLIECKNNYEIIIDTANLLEGKNYMFEFSNGNFEWTESDENTQCIAQTIDSVSVGIGIYNPNENEIEKRYLENRPYDESKMKFYIVNEQDYKNGWKFKFLDKSEKKIIIKVAWIENKELFAKDCESAIGFWLT